MKLDEVRLGLKLVMCCGTCEHGYLSYHKDDFYCTYHLTIDPEIYEICDDFLKDKDVWGKDE